VTNQNSNKLLNSLPCYDEFKSKHNPWQIHSFELSSEPKVDNGILVDHTPHVENGEDHLVHHDVHVEEQGGDGAEGEIEQQHEEIISGSSIKQTSLESRTVAVEKVEIN